MFPSASHFLFSTFFALFWLDFVERSSVKVKRDEEERLFETSFSKWKQKLLVYFAGITSISPTYPSFSCPFTFSSPSPLFQQPLSFFAFLYSCSPLSFSFIIPLRKWCKIQFEPLLSFSIVSFSFSLSFSFSHSLRLFCITCNLLQSLLLPLTEKPDPGQIIFFPRLFYPPFFSRKESTNFFICAYDHNFLVFSIFYSSPFPLIFLSFSLSLLSLLQISFTA